MGVSRYNKGMRYVVVFSNNEGGSPAVICEDLPHAKAAVLDYLFDAQANPPITSPAEVARIRGEVHKLTGDYTESVFGGGPWKDVVYIAPVAEWSSL